MLQNNVVFVYSPTGQVRKHLTAANVHLTLAANILKNLARAFE